MFDRKRIIIICVLIMVGILIFGITKIYEKRFISKNEFSNISPYAPYEGIYSYEAQNRERYVRYHSKNKDLSYEDVVVRVNIGLDYGFYKFINKANYDKDIFILVNKYTRLGSDYVPNDLEKIDDAYFINGNKNVRLMRKEAKEAFERLSLASIESGYPVYGQSAYRDYNRQEEIYNLEVKNYGVSWADKDVARPGHSEHQTGLSIDVSSNKSGNMLQFDKTSSFDWMMNNAYKYGFILRYPKGLESIHGFIYESWHFRYVGVRVASDLHNKYSNLTYDEYYYKFLDK